MPTPILTIPQLDIAFSTEKSRQYVLRDFQLSLHAGSCMGLIGESGSGKTLSALAILQLLPNRAEVSCDSRILFREQNLLKFSEKQMRHIRGKHISMIFQDALSALNPVFTIGQQLLSVIRLHLRLSHKTAKIRALSLLESVGIQNSLRCFQSYPHELSGGMRQRALIAMAIAAEPSVIIADEPTTALDVTIQAQVLELLSSLQSQKKCALLFIGHDLAVVSKMADEVTVLQQGRIVEQGRAKTFFQAPKHSYSQKLFDAVLPNVPRKLDHDPHAEQILSVDYLKIYFPIHSGILRRTKDFIKAVDGVTFELRCGETLALVGESGSGKTTVAKGILQLIPNTDGTIIFDKVPLRDLSSSELRKKRSDMQIIFQDSSSALNPRMMIADSLCEGLFIQKKVRNKKDAIAQVKELLLQVELSDDVLMRYPHEFSGGQRQRLCIARALTLSPKLLILDEPTSALDASTQLQILRLLDRLQKEKQLSYLLITHNISVVAYLATMVAVMHRGEIVEYGDVNTVLQIPQNNYTKNLLRSVPEIIV